MKKLFVLLVLLGSIFEVSALSCTDLQKNLVRGAENSDVLALQGFLYEKGYLKANPNGYFGAGTLTAVKNYQGAKGLARSGQVFPLTRETIKKESCGSTNTRPSPSQAKQSSSEVKATTTVVAPSASKVLTPQEIRQRDVNAILAALYKAYKDTGEYPISYSTSSAWRICRYGIGECVGYVEIASRIVPKYLSEIPRDPAMGSSTDSGYTIYRESSTNNLVVASTYKIGFVPISATCNFNAGCPIQETDTSVKKPEITALDNTIFFSGGRQTEPFKITGNNFSEKGNTIIITSTLSRKAYVLGEFASSDGVTLSATTSFTYDKLPCGAGCKEALPLGAYTVSVKNAGGESNYFYITLKSVSAHVTPNSPDASFTPSTTHRKLATISISSEEPLTLENLEFTMVGSSTITSKITTFTLTDLLTGQTINSGPKFSLGSKVLSNNDSKIYELYANIGEVELHQSGRVIFQGQLKVKGSLNKNAATFPLEDFMITVSY
jgi:peptidoglycan hydrolase-like protein with peptidoglycan-binding domain